jgi:hypothetical protein
VKPIVPPALEVEQTQLVIEIRDKPDVTMPADHLDDRGRTASPGPEDDDQH